MSTVRAITPELAREVPNAPELERAVLGALLISPSAWIKVADLIRPELFYSEPNRVLYQAMRELWSVGSVVDMLTLTDRMRRDGLLEFVGGAFYIASLTNAVASTANIDVHLRLLVEHHIARELITIGSKASDAAYKGGDALDLLDHVSVAITDLYGYTIGNHTTTAADGIGELTDGQPGKHFAFGMPELDRRAVFQAGLPHVFAGRPGMGKSVFALEVMWHLTLTGPVMLFTPEMTLRQVQARIVAREAGVPYSTILRGRMDQQERDDVARVSMEIAGRLKLLKVDPTSGITPDQVRARVERSMKQDGIIAFGVDHLHEMRTGHAATDRKEFDRVSICMAGLTEVAKRSNLPALIMCQLSRQTESRGDKRPTLADLRGSGAIEEKAALVGLLYREGYYQAEPPYEDNLEINIAKNRDGAVGQCIETITPALSRIGHHNRHAPRSFTEPTKDENSPF